MGMPSRSIHLLFLHRAGVPYANGCVVASPTQGRLERGDKWNMTFYVSAAHQVTVVGGPDSAAVYEYALVPFAARTTSAICSASASMPTSEVLKAILSASDGL